MKLEIGYNHDFEIRKEIYTCCRSGDLSILYVSDLHWNGYSQVTASNLEKSIADLDPTIILLGGDYVDTRNGLNILKQFLQSIANRQNVFAIAGNHDYFFGIHKIKTLMRDFNVFWIEDSVVKIDCNGFELQITDHVPPGNFEEADLNILCLHKPVDVYALKRKFNLVFAGHLHGSQFVFWQTPKGLYPGRLFYRWNLLKTRWDNCLYLISKGLGDTLPIRYNCKKDIIFVEVTGGA